MAVMKMDNPATADATAALPEGQGKINSIDSEKYSVNITHEPIEALKWPGMTMDFPVVWTFLVSRQTISSLSR